MNYSEQQIYLAHGRFWATLLVVLLLALAALSLVTAAASLKTSAVFGLVVAATAVSLAYTPDYLHLTANSKKRQRWQIKIRWRIAAAVVIL